jgi:hypothetical protein
MLTRMVLNLAQVYIPPFLVDTIKMTNFSLAVFPAIMYLCSFAMTLKQPSVDRWLGRKYVGKCTYFAVFARSPTKWLRDIVFRKSFAAGGAASALGAAVFFFTPDKTQSPVGSAAAVTIACMLMGVGGTGLMVGAVSLQADLIGNHINSGEYFLTLAMFFLQRSGFFYAEERYATALWFVAYYAANIHALPRRVRVRGA